jgi:tRNA 2-thiouridine synthesizing protein A
MRRLDVSGLSCPLPVLRTRKLLAGMNVGESLEIVTTDPMSVVDMPVFCAQAGHRVLHLEKSGERFIFTIARGEKP